MESNDDQHFGTVLRAYERSGVPIILEELPENMKNLLYGGNWNRYVIKRLYSLTTSYFIPRGQQIAKMYSVICYTKDHIKGAKEQADFITKRFEQYGFIHRPPLIDWDSDQLMAYLSTIIKEIKYQSSVLFICIMGYGDSESELVYDVQDKPVRIETMLSKLKVLPSYIPVVSIAILLILGLNIHVVWK